jgi:hypothetical protein
MKGTLMSFAHLKRHWRQTFVVSMVVVMLSTALGGSLPQASAQSIPGLPKGVDGAAYLAQYNQIKADLSTCLGTTNGDKKAMKACADTAKKALEELIKKIRDDIKKAKGDHDHDTGETGPVAPPTVPTEPVDNAPNVPPTTSPLPEPVTGARHDAKILVIAADGTEPQLGAIKQTLDYMGTPYDILVSKDEALTAEKLYSGERAFYYGVILTNGEAGYEDPVVGYTSGLSIDEWNLLNTFEANFKIRQVTWYTWPNPVYGFTYPEKTIDTSTSPVTGTLTTAGKQFYSYLTLAPINVKQAWTYLAKPVDATTIPLISTSDGYALAAIKSYPDGRENLAMTFDTNQYLVHSHQVGYGAVNWLTKGQYLGQRRVYMDAQVDDVFYPNDLWNVNDPTTMVEAYRMSGDDLKKTDDWQRRWQGTDIGKNLRLSMVFNGEGTSGAEEYLPDTFTPKAKELQSRFKWINHTWTHLNLNSADYATTYEELRLNLELARTMGLTNFSSKNLVTPEISGLFNPEAMRAIKDIGIKYVVSDTSRPEFGNPSPNTATYNTAEPSIMMIPRRPNNLFYNVSTPDQWVSEYNKMYRSYWGRDLTYTELLNLESDVLLQYVMRGEIYPWMFHQANLRFYDGTRSLLTDLLDATLNKYRSMFRLPILSPRQDETAMKIEERMAYNAAGVSATFNRAENSVTLRSNQTVVVPITGVRYGSAVATYAGQSTSYVTVPANTPYTIPIGT